MRAPYRIGLLGLGHVGGALARRLVDDRRRIEAAAGRPILLEAIAVAHPQGRRAPADLVPAERLLELQDLDAVVELIGGLEPAHTYIYRVLQSGRQAITANKQVVAAHGPRLATMGPLRFEAAVASAIPIVEMLAEALAADRVRSLAGILNGTTNSILDAMEAGESYAGALADAQRRGLAEADPSADVDAHDPAAKLAILSMLAFRRRIDPATIERIGIRDLDQGRLAEARSRGCVVKLVAAAADAGGNGIQADVRPRLIPLDAPLARVRGAMNAVTVESDYAGSLVFMGPGAGPDAAASAVVADLVRAACDLPASAGATLASLCEQPAAAVTPLASGIPYAVV
jgi:homoserine dehydrogenase